MLYWIEWQFWSWKSSLATHIAREVSIISAKNIAKSLTKSWNIVLSNIKMDKELISNYYYFEDDKFLEVLRTCNAVNDLERELYGVKKSKWWLKKRERKKFSKFYLFFDEVWAIANNHLKLQDNHIYAEYINQNRKNFEDIYLITAKWWQTNKTLRQMVDWWFYVEPLSRLPLLCDIWIIRKQKKDEDWKIEMKHYIWKDPNWDYIRKEKPHDYFVDWFWKPWIWSYYDDLHKNIRDPDKYLNINNKLFNQILSNKKELNQPLLENTNFNDLKEHIKILPPNISNNVLDNSNNQLPV